MSLSGFDKPGVPLRGNLHCHSTLSDGHREPREVIGAYESAGYDFLAITDHFEAQWGWVVCEPTGYQTPMTLLRAAELSSTTWSDAPLTQADPDVYWVIAAGLPPNFDPPGHDESQQDVIARAHASGAFVGLVHPQLSDIRDAQALTIDHIDAVEVFDQSSVLWDNRPEAWHTCETLLRAGRKVTAFASDDNHADHPWDGFGAWVQVRAADRTPVSVIQALKAGDYYATHGPTIEHLERVNGKLTIHTSPARAVIASGADWRATTHFVDDRLTTAAFDLEPFAGSYVRLTVVDEHQRRAWTNPIWLDASDEESR